MLGLAAGDTAGGAWDMGYSAVTEQATVIAYDLIAHGQIDRARLVSALRELDGSHEEEPVYRSESPEFRAWLDRAATGNPTPDETPSLDPLGRSAPIGLVYKRDPENLYREAIGLNRIFHTDDESILAGVVAAAAVAASCFGQAGRDLLKGVAEAVAPAVREIAEGSVGLAEPDQISNLPERISGLVSAFGSRTAAEAMASVTDAATPGPIDVMLACLLIAAPTGEAPHEPVAQAVKLGGSNAGAATGAIIGARTGIRAWPWPFANDTWFAELGRRLARGPHEIRDLPIPYAVEQHLISGIRT